VRNDDYLLVQKFFTIFLYTTAHRFVVTWASRTRYNFRALEIGTKEIIYSFLGRYFVIYLDQWLLAVNSKIIEWKFKLYNKKPKSRGSKMEIETKKGESGMLWRGNERNWMGSTMQVLSTSNSHFLAWILTACLFLFLTPDLATLRLLCTALNLARAAFFRSGL